MAFTVAPTVPTDAYVNTRLTQIDFLYEPIVKGNLLANAGGLYQSAMRAYESVSQAGIKTASVSSSHTVTAFNTTPGNAGDWSKAGDVLILAFTREHPVASMAGTIITNEFVIIAPHPDIISVPDNPGDLLFPVMDRGETFATAANREGALGALVNWLEDSLVVTVLKTRYAGNWTYSETKTRFASLPKQYDGYSVS